MHTPCMSRNEATLMMDDNSGVVLWLIATMALVGFAVTVAFPLVVIIGCWIGARL